MGRRASIFIGAIAAVIAAEGAAAEDRAATRLSGYVPVTCTASLAPSAMLDGRLTGQLTELCNNADGYRLVLIHPSGLEQARVEINGQSVALNANATQTIIVDSNDAAHVVRDFALVVPGHDGPHALAIYAEPKSAPI